MKKINSLQWYNKQIEILHVRLSTSDFDYMQGFAVGLDTMERLQRERFEKFGIPIENKKYTW